MIVNLIKHACRFYFAKVVNLRGHAPPRYNDLAPCMGTGKDPEIKLQLVYNSDRLCRSRFCVWLIVIFRVFFRIAIINDHFTIRCPTAEQRQVCLNTREKVSFVG